MDVILFVIYIFVIQEGVYYSLLKDESNFSGGQYAKKQGYVCVLTYSTNMDIRRLGAGLYNIIKINQLKNVKKCNIMVRYVGYACVLK